MNDEEIEKVIENTSFTMEVESFILTPEEKDDLRKFLWGEVSYVVYGFMISVEDFFFSFEPHINIPSCNCFKVC